MVSVVLMAGYEPYSKKHIRMKKKIYKENYAPSGYKPLKMFSVRVDSKTYVQKSLIQLTMEKFETVEKISDIVTVGYKNDLESALDSYISSSKKRYTFVDQSGEIDEYTLKLFGIKRENIREGSIAANGLKAYINTDAFLRREHAFFVACDTPKTSEKTIEYLIDESEKYLKNFSIVFPLVSKKELPAWRHFVHRKYLFLVNDTEYQLEGRFKTKITERDGFRVSSMMYANPFRIDLNKMNLGYELRNLRSPFILSKVKKLLKQNDLEWAWDKYFEKDLSVTDAEKAVSQILCKDGFGIKAIPITDVFSSFDYDETDKDEKEMNKILSE
jgi:hypothetical protein